MFQLVMGDKQAEAPLQAIQLLLDTPCSQWQEERKIYCLHISGSSTSFSIGWNSSKLNLHNYTSTIRGGKVSPVVPDSIIFLDLDQLYNSTA